MKPEPNDLIPTRVSLLERLRRWDDQESWREFFARYWKLIYTAATRSGLNDAEAQDVVQETVIIVAKKMEGFRYDPAVDSFKGWLLYLTRKQIAMQFRRRERERGPAGAGVQNGEGVLHPEEIADASFCSDALWEEEWQKHLLEAALARVRERVNAKQFQMFDLYVTKQCPVQQVAELMGVPVAQVYLAKHRIVALAREEAKRLESQML